MKDSGCCGADEFLKLWAYTLTEYHRVVHLGKSPTNFSLVPMVQLFLIPNIISRYGFHNIQEYGRAVQYR